MLPAGLPVPTLAVILVIAVVPTNVREGRRTTAEAKREQPNAGQSVVIAVPHAQAGVPLIPVPLSVITNAAAPAGLVQPLVRPVLPPPTPAVAADQPRMNAERRPVIILINHATLTPILVRQGIQPLALTDIPVQLTKNVLAGQQAVPNVTNVTPPLPAANQAGVAAVMRADVEQMERQVLVRLSIYRLMVRVIMIFA